VYVDLHLVGIHVRFTVVDGAHTWY